MQLQDTPSRRDGAQARLRVIRYDLFMTNYELLVSMLRTCNSCSIFSDLLGLLCSSTGPAGNGSAGGPPLR